MNRVTNIFNRIIFFRILRTVYFLFKSAYISPLCIILGRDIKLKIGIKSVISNGVRINLESDGRIYLSNNVWLSRDVEVETNGIVSIGSHTVIQRRSSINGDVKIGRECLIAPNVFISSGNHTYYDCPHLSIREQERIGIDGDRMKANEAGKEIWVQDDSWLGVNAVVLQSVIIGKGAVIAANSLVVHNVLPYSIMAGVPAKKVGFRLIWEPPKALNLCSAEDHVYVIEGQKYDPDKVLLGVLVDFANPAIFIVNKYAKVIMIEVSHSSKNTLIAGENSDIVNISDGIANYPVNNNYLMHDGIVVKLQAAYGEKYIVKNIFCN